MSGKSTYIIGVRILFGFAALLAYFTAWQAGSQTAWIPSFRQFGGICQGSTNNPPLNTTISFERDDVYWDTLATNSTSWNAGVLTNWGNIVLAYQAQNMQFLPILDYTAAWAADKSARSWTNGTTVYSVVPTNNGNMEFYKYVNGVLNTQTLLTNFSKFPPVDVNTFSNYAYKVASFLHAPPYNVQYFQVWNEANWDNGYWYDSMNNYIKKIVVPSAEAIHAVGGKVVYGGWPDVSTPSSLLHLLDTNNAWSSIDVLDMHYFNVGDVQTLRAGADSRGYTNMAIWQSEVGFTSDYTFIGNYFPRALFWNLTNNWTQDKYRAFYFCNYAPNDPKAYGYNDALFSGAVLNGGGIVMTNLANVLGGTNRLSQFIGVTSSPALYPQVWPQSSSMETFTYSTNIVIVIHLTTGDFTNYSAVSLYLPVAPGDIVSASRVGMDGSTSNLLTDIACKLTASGTGSQLTVPTAEAVGSQAQAWNAASSNPTFYVWIATSSNLALNKTVTASSLENSGYPATNAVDGNFSTRWSSAFSDPQWIYVDLGAPFDISRVTLYWEAAYAKNYQIQISSDAVNWTTIYSTTNGTGGINDLTGLSGSGRYVRMYGTQRATSYGYSLYEFQIFGVPYSLSLGQPALASSTESSSYPAGNAVDGSGFTRWSSAFSDPQWIYVDLGATYNISQVILSWEGAYGKSYQVQVSSDTVNWTTIYSTTNGTGGINNLMNLSGSGRYVRMYGLQRGTSYGYSLYEFQVFGTLIAPTGLAATAGDAQVSLTWNGVGGAGTYNVKRATSLGGPFTTIGSTTSASFVDTSALNGMTYYYVVTAVNVAGEGASSASASVTLNLIPPPWASQDIGSVGVPGSATYLNGLFTVTGSGSDIWNSSDNFQYVYQTGSGDCSLQANVLTVQNTSSYAKGGVMIRETLNSDSTMAIVDVTPSSGVEFLWRSTTGGNASATVASGITAPDWVKLSRTGNNFIGYYSGNGTTWTAIATNTINMATNVYIGMAVCAHDNATNCTATFTNVVATP